MGLSELRMRDELLSGIAPGVPVPHPRSDKGQPIGEDRRGSFISLNRP